MTHQIRFIENEADRKEVKKKFACEHETAAFTTMTVARNADDPKPRNYWCVVAPIGTNRNRNVAVHHDRWLKRYDEFREHAQMAPRPLGAWPETASDPQTMKMV